MSWNRYNAQPQYGNQYPSTVHSSGHFICQICSELRLDSSLTAPQSSVVRYSQYTQFKLSSWHNSSQWSPTCQLCALFEKVSGNRSFDDRTPYALRFVARSLMNAHDWGTPELSHVLVQGIERPAELSREDLRERELGLLFLAVTKDHEMDRCSTAELTTDVRSSGVLSWHHANEWDRNRGRGKVIDHLRADMNLVNSWLSYCQNYHKQCRPEFHHVERLRLINCVTYTIEAAPPSGAMYLALSYVWGQQVPSEIDVVGNKLIAERLPKTITDAILATRQLGYHYLWVDRYCIPDDPQIRHKQISQMDIIYRNAMATLIGVSGTNSSYGLPGITSRSRNQQISVQLNNITIFTIPPHPETSIQKSVWMTRGWTYQEAVLSRRRIFFTDDQVYFECNGMQCMESLPSNLDEWHTTDRSSFLGVVDRPIFTVPTVCSGLNALRYLETKYTGRNLSFDTDSLRGFLGILGFLETLIPGLHHWWGIPFTTQFDHHSRPYVEDFIRLTRARAPRGDAFVEARLPGRAQAETTTLPILHHQHDDRSWNSEHCFLNELLWQHVRSTCRRRHELPSWTWAGWAGSIKMLSSSYHGCNCDPSVTEPKILGTFMEDNSFVQWKDLIPYLGTRRIPISEQPRAIVLETMAIQLKIVEINDQSQHRLVRNGYYITKDLGDIRLRDGCLRDCTVYSQLHLDNVNDLFTPTAETFSIGYIGLILGCGENLGLLVVRPAPEGGCDRIGVINITRGSEFQGELTELESMENSQAPEFGRMMKHWFTGNDDYHAVNCSFYDIGSYVAVKPLDTTIEDWRFNAISLQSILV